MRNLLMFQRNVTVLSLALCAESGKMGRTLKSLRILGSSIFYTYLLTLSNLIIIYPTEFMIQKNVR